MESKSSLPPFGFGDDRRSLNQSSSALRAFTSSTRLTQRRSRRDSISTTSSTCLSSSSSSTRSSIECTAPPSCVTRATSQDQCALHRFIVWAAIQRNSCQKMTPADRLECPLLRCRKRFLNHEVMLRHLYSCEMLSTGEYWCYECGKAEKFTDGKCKRCLGHPGKRRKIMSVAKNFFSSLGQRSKPQPVIPHLDMDDAVMLPPPSYDSLVVQPQEVELSSSSEILEIDSVEVSLPLLPPTFAPGHVVEEKPMEHFPVMGMEQTTSTMPNLSLECTPLGNFDTNEISIGKVDRPSLSINTHSLEHYRKQHKPAPRTKNLSPSASLRSNASTDSTASTDTNASYVVSPTSVFSSAWTNAGTSITSPTSGSISPGGYLSRGCSNASHYSNRSIPLHTFISELPAEEVLLQPLPQTIPNDLGRDRQLLSIDTTNMANPLTKSTVASTQKSQKHPVATQEPVIRVSAPFVDARSLVGAAWDALKAHVSSSMEKLQHLSHHPVVAQLQGMTPRSIADTGLTALKSILDGRQPASMIEWLCFVHVTYSLSLVVYEDDTRNRSKQLFAQAQLYSNRFVPMERGIYLEVASAIWQPLDLSTSELDGLLLERYQGSVSRSSSTKGKEREAPLVRPYSNQDTFVEIAQFFLDELERTALLSKVLESREVLTSELLAKHLDDAGGGTAASPALVTATSRTVRNLNQSFSHANGLSPKLKRFKDRITAGRIRSVRRAELELIQAGKGCIPPHEYFDNYVLRVREHFNPLYQQHVPGYVPRSTFYARGIELVQTIIAGICDNEMAKEVVPDPVKTTGEGDLDEFFRTMTTGLDDSLDDILKMSCDPLAFPETLPDVQFSTETGPSDSIAAFYGAQNTVATILQQPLPAYNTDTDGSTGSEQTIHTSAEQRIEVEANSCCEICGYRPKGHPQWFKGSMAKHKKLQHSAAPPKIYRCPFPGCTSQYKNRPDNLKQHQQDKGHFVGGESERRPSKRKKRE